MTTDSFLRLTERLSEASVKRRWEAYRDVDWDAPEHRIELEDPCWEASAGWDPLAASEWYRDQEPARRASIALRRQLAALKVGIEFERVLSQGLLRFAGRLPNGHPAFRYVLHEITEEAQHSLMFQEFINRAGFDPGPAPDHVQVLFDRVAGLSDDLPVLFFLAVVSGEEVFDYVNRQNLAAPSTHPLLARISRIHITEEARHLSFARAYMREAVSRMEHRDIRKLRYEVAFIIDWISTHMFAPSPGFLDELGVPGDVVEEIAGSERSGKVRRDSVAGVTTLCRSLGLVDPRMATVWARVLAPAPGV
jgi:ribosomal protein S18 acetylase RimI-like enzyme